MTADESRFHLEEIALRPILSEVGIGRLSPAALQSLIVEAHDDPDPATMCMQMFYVLMALNKIDFALEMQSRALALQCLYRIAGPSRPTVRLLAFMGPGGSIDNTPFEFVIEGAEVRLDLLYLLPNQDPPARIPDHDVVVVAIGQSARNRPLLMKAKDMLRNWPRPVLNEPDAIMGCARDEIYKSLSGIPGLLVPHGYVYKRCECLLLELPLTIRPIDSQAGLGFERIENDSEWAAYFERVASEEYYVSEYIDYRGCDGLYRKIRIVLIDRKPYVCHLAISEHWMVHYLSSGMHLSEQKRAEEEAMMESFDQGFAVRHRAALEAIAERLKLDYVVLDCAELPDGRLLLFEADSRGWIHATDPVELFPYKPKTMKKAFDAFRALLVNRSAGSPPAALPGNRASAASDG